MRQPLLMLAMASCLAAPAAFAQSRADTAAAAQGAASATARVGDDRAAPSSARRAMTSFTSLLREAALQTQPSARAAAGTPPAATTLQADNRDLHDPQRTAATP